MNYGNISLRTQSKQSGVIEREVLCCLCGALSPADIFEYIHQKRGFGHAAQE